MPSKDNWWGMGNVNRDLMDPRSKQWKEEGREPGDLPPRPKNPCRFVFTMRFKKPPFAIRCHCMAGYGHSPEKFNYDPLAFVWDIHEALRIWKAHVAQRKLEEESLTSIASDDTFMAIDREERNDEGQDVSGV